MNTVEEGVANFRDFQGLMRDFVSSYNQREADRDKFEKQREAETERRNKAQDRRTNLMTALVALATLLLSILLAWHGWEDAHIAVPRAQSSVLSSAQDAGIRRP